MMPAWLCSRSMHIHTLCHRLWNNNFRATRFTREILIAKMIKRQYKLAKRILPQSQIHLLRLFSVHPLSCIFRILHLLVHTVLRNFAAPFFTLIINSYRCHCTPANGSRSHFSGFEEYCCSHFSTSTLRIRNGLFCHGGWIYLNENWWRI